MEDEIVERIAFQNLPNNICALTGNPVKDAAVMHRDLSDWWPEDLHDMRDERLVNLLIVERVMRDHYYEKMKNMGVVLAFSGGLDSTTVLHWCRHLFYSVHCLIFDYGQRHKIELDTAVRYIEGLAEQQTPQENSVDAPLTYQVVDMKPIKQLSESSLTRFNIEVPVGRAVEDMSESIPNTFVPGRNVYFITALAQAAYQRGWRHIAMGCNILDYSGYPDCRPEFFEHMRRALSVGVFNSRDVGVHMPLMYLDKRSIIRLGTTLGVKYEDTHSCYQGIKGGCRECDSCKLRIAAFHDLGIEDPAFEKYGSV